MTDKTVSVPQHGIDCEKAPHLGEGYLHSWEDDRPYDVDGLMYCGRCHRTMSEKPRVSVPTESRPRKCPTCDSPAPERHPAMQFEGEVQMCKDGWHNFGDGKQFAASSSLLPVPTEPILKLIERYEYEIGRGFWDVSQDGMRHILRDLKLLASLPVGESTRDEAAQKQQAIARMGDHRDYVGLGESREPLPDPRCIVKGHSSRVCELGTKCCVVQHSEWRDNGQEPVPSVPAEIESTEPKEPS